MSTAKDTLINFLALTKCNQTQKHICLKEKLIKFKQLNSYFDDTKLEMAIKQKSPSSPELTDLKSFFYFFCLLLVFFSLLTFKNYI